MRRVAVELVALGLRRAPFERGRWRVIPPALRWARAALPGQSVRTVRTREGFRLAVRLGDWLGRHVFVTGEYEPDTARVIRGLLRPGGRFVDVGANVGYFSLLAARRVGPAGRVYAFEPVEPTRRALERNLGLNRAANVTVRPEALSDRAGEVSFFVGPDDHRGTSSLRPLEDAGNRVTVPQARLDDLLPPGERIDVIKIDVEGAEHLALAGMVGCLRRDRPSLVVEVTDKFLREMGSSAGQLCGFLSGLGYRMFSIDYAGLHPFDPGGPFPGQFNALFTTRDPLPPDVRPSAGVTAVGS